MFAKIPAVDGRLLCLECMRIIVCEQTSCTNNCLKLVYCNFEILPHFEKGSSNQLVRFIDLKIMITIVEI